MIVIITKIFIYFDVFRFVDFICIRSPTIRVRANITCLAWRVVLDCARCIVARIKSVAEVINAGFIAGCGCFFGGCSARRNELGGGRDRNRCTGFAAGDSGERRNERIFRSASWTRANFGVFDDEDGFGSNNLFDILVFCCNQHRLRDNG